MAAMNRKCEIAPLGDCAVVVTLGQQPDENVHRLVTLLSQYLEEKPISGMIEYIPAFISVTILYDPLQVMMSMQKAEESFVPAASGAPGTESYPHAIISRQLERIVDLLQESNEVTPRLVEIPVCYGGEYGPDLDFVASHNGISAEDVIRLHGSRDYLVYMLGFAPGFPYLGGMDKRIAAPRKATPRLAIPRGSVAIAGEQTGIYPIETPGGWQLIGSTPMQLFLPYMDPPTLLQAGDRIRFYPITRNEYDRWGR